MNIYQYADAGEAPSPNANFPAGGSNPYGAAQKCSICHSIAGKGNTKGPLDGVGAKWKPDEIREWIVHWKEMAKKYKATRLPPMKDFSGLPAAEVDALVAYLETLK